MNITKFSLILILSIIPIRVFSQELNPNVPDIVITESHGKLAPRCLLTEPVTATVTGNVYDVAKALLDDTDYSYLVGNDSDAFKATKEFIVENIPLWQALDKTLDIFDYDWGIQGGAIVLWPATFPARDRETPPTNEMRKVPDPSQHEVVFSELTSVTKWVDELDISNNCIIHSNYANWHVAGRIFPDTRAIDALCGALSAANELGYDNFFYISPTAARKMDWALTLADKIEADKSISPTEYVERARKGIYSVLTAQQFQLMLDVGVARILFFELPTEAAAYVCLAAGQHPVVALKDHTASPDWSKPDKIYAEVIISHTFNQTEIGGNYTECVKAQVSIRIPLTNGSMLVF